MTESVELSLLQGGGLRRLQLARYPDGSWMADDRPVPELEGALDCDVLASPIFNTMPVLRHAMLAGGAPRDLVMAFVTVPDLGVTRSEQRYDAARRQARSTMRRGTSAQTSTSTRTGS